MSIKVKLILIFIVLIVAVVIPSSVALVLFFDNTMRQEIDVQLLNHAANIISHVEEGQLTREEPFPLTIDLATDVVYQLWDENGNLISGAPHAGQESLNLEDVRFVGRGDRYQELTINNETYQIKILELYMGSTKGSLLVGINYSRIETRQKELLFSVILIDVIGSLLAGTLIWLLIIQQFKQLKDITEFAKSDILDRKMYLRFPLPKNVNNETRDMIIAVNQGLERIEKMFNSQKRFLADVSHELRTPLTVLKGNVGLMRLMKEYDDESLATMEREIDRLSRLVGDLLMFAQADADEVQLNMTEFDFDELFLEVYEQIKVLAKQKCEVELVEIDPVQIIGDEDRLKQVMINLGSNAIKFTPRGGRIKMGMTKAEDKVCFYVSDNGPGISEEDIPHIFERLYRGDKSRQQYFEDDRSYGIGLAISEWIVKQHQGEIQVESKVGKGSTFTVCLPMKPKIEEGKKLKKK